jgi:hypothetical protein
MNRRILIALVLTIGSFSMVFCQENIQLSNKHFDLQFNKRGLTHISSPADTYQANGIEDRQNLGEVDVRYRIAEGDWLNVFTYERRHELSEEENSITYTDYLSGMPFSMVQEYALHEDYMDWTVTVESQMYYSVLIGDFSMPFPWNKPSDDNQIEIFEKSFIKHHYISGNGSYLIFTKPSGNPPFLLVTAKNGTPVEYFTSGGGTGYTLFFHSGLTGNNETRGTWRQDHTNNHLDPAGGEQVRIEYGFRFRWASSYDELREYLYQDGLFDIRVVPGMSLPDDLTAKFSLHTKASIDSIVPEYPKYTELEYLGEQPGEHYLYEVDFQKLGENMLTIYYNGDQKTYLEFFSTEPVETLIKKRSSFIVNSQQHRNPEKWYNGLFSVYDMKNAVLRGPDNTDGFDYWYGYVLACDDPALCKAPYVAAKNVFFPEDKEIEAVEYYLEYFVWGGLQRTDQDDPYPYGIYGTPNWMVNRDTLARAGVKNRNLDKMNIWRSYDYPHMFMLYFHMYQIASMYPEKVKYLDAEGYLERAYQTARAYFIYPYEVLPWYETYKIGCYNELVVLDLIRELEKHKRFDEAEFLRKEWEKKAKYFVYDDPYPFGSEYSIDRTAFESSYALAKYGTINEMEPDSNLWWDKRLEKWYSHPEVSKKKSYEFLERQHYAGLSVRGWLETKYFLLGSDWSVSSDQHCLSYMAKMGGWSILDYGMVFADDPSDWLQLGYASYLSSWSLMNTGTEESDYGYWFPGKENDGATGWAFMPSKFGRAWIRKNVPRGAWHYDGEADLGYGAGIRTAITILTNDPLFGWIAYGGKLNMAGEEFWIYPKDGLRSRFAVITEDKRIHFELSRDGFIGNEPIHLSGDLGMVSGVIENRSHNDHVAELMFIQGEPTRIFLDGKEIDIKKSGEVFSALLRISKDKHNLEIIF